MVDMVELLEWLGLVRIDSVAGFAVFFMVAIIVIKIADLILAAFECREYQQRLQELRVKCRELDCERRDG